MRSADARATGRLKQGLHRFKGEANVPNMVRINSLQRHGFDALMTLAALITIAFIAFLARGALAAGARLEQISRERQKYAELHQVS